MILRALAIDEARLGADHPSVARDLNNLALLLRGMNRLAEAEPLVVRALRICCDSLGPDHPTAQGVARNLGLILQALGRSEAEIAAALAPFSVAPKS
jgi:hypothetical protein